MAFDEGLAELIRTDLADHSGVEEKQMFELLPNLWTGSGVI